MPGRSPGGGEAAGNRRQSRRLLCCGVVLCLAFAAAPARAQLSACYNVTWLGFPLAEMVYAEERADAVVHSQFVVESVGLVDVFGPFRYEAVADTRSADGEHEPLGYTARDGPDPRAQRIIDLSFDPATGGIDEIVKPPRDETKVEPALRRGAIDPMTAFIATRASVRDAEARGMGSLRLPIYDGSKRYDVEVVMAGRERVSGMGEAVKAMVTLHPIAGFDDPKAGTEGPAEVWFGVERDFMPLKVNTGGPGSVWLADLDQGGDCRF